MQVKNKQLFTLMEELAPKRMAEDWDNVGIQIGDSFAVAQKVLLTLDVNEQVVNEAIAKKCQLIISHHPLFFKGIKCLDFNTPQGSLLKKLVQNEITVYAAHTNLDSTIGGVNDVLAATLGLEKVRVLQAVAAQKFIKLVVFVPETHRDIVAQAIGDAGAGFIGNYSDCAFYVEGTGTFRPREGCHPFVGKVDELNKVAESRIETILPAEKAIEVVNKMLAVHPYEEVAYDLYHLENTGKEFGLGRIGNLPDEMSLKEFVLWTKKALKVDHLKVGGDLDSTIKRVAVCGGAGSDLWQKALQMGADVYLTGDVKYHTAQDMLAAGLSFLDAGHYYSEIVILPALLNQLESACVSKGYNLEFCISQISKDPFMYF